MEDSVPEAFHKKEQVSRTLEYAVDDYALSVLAKSLKKTDDCKTLQQRALNYRKVFDRSTGMVRRRYSNGTWDSPFLPDHRELYIAEGMPRQYSFYMPQDVQGPASLMGGAKHWKMHWIVYSGKMSTGMATNPVTQFPLCTTTRRNLGKHKR